MLKYRPFRRKVKSGGFNQNFTMLTKINCKKKIKNNNKIMIIIIRQILFDNQEEPAYKASKFNARINKVDHLTDGGGSGSLRKSLPGRTLNSFTVGSGVGLNLKMNPGSEPSPSF